MSAAAFGYSVLNAQDTLADSDNDSSASEFDCNGVNGKVVIAKDSGQVNATAGEGDLHVPAEDDKRCNVPGTDIGDATTLKFTESGNTCVIESSGIEGKEQEASGGEDKISTGNIRITIPLGAGRPTKPAKFEATIKLTPDSKHKSDALTVSGTTTTAVIMKSCDRGNLPTGTFTVKGDVHVVEPK
ncbi:hypothetical protein [Nocardia arthritidis]|uniref:Uncharacterized protein n=1 Tax=Nocardia arthritidis TaxID=228602 RepID=A0A6G9YJD4_9NOCA|nr:hypothetical protein [Nocardia arthritidis]QIS13146.1 hypothetical protein F5544_26460 [Nocardia arthritidis]